MNIIVDKLVQDFKPFRVSIDVMTQADRVLLFALLRVAGSSINKDVSVFAKEIGDLLP